MKLLLDTQLLIWSYQDPNRLGSTARALIEDARNDLFASAASIWELAIKYGLGGRTGFTIDVGLFRRELLENGFGELDITGDHALAVGRLPPIHKDPFDRLLVAQATIEGVALLTADALLARYPGPIQVV